MLLLNEKKSALNDETKMNNIDEQYQIKCNIRSFQLNGRYTYVINTRWRNSRDGRDAHAI
jgi:hypothetical protein